MRSTHTAKTYDNFQRRGAILLRKLAAPRTPDWLATSSAVRSKPGSSSRKRNLPTTCDGGGPAGLALLPGERLMTSCGTVLDARSGRVLANVTNPFDGSAVSGDEIWYNPGTTASTLEMAAVLSPSWMPPLMIWFECRARPYILA